MEKENRKSEPGTDSERGSGNNRTKSTGTTEKEEKKGCKEVKGKKDFKEKDKRTAIIIGGGTSVKSVLDDPCQYKALHNHVLFGCNKAVQHFDCDYFIYHDHPFARQNKILLNTFKGQGIYAPGTGNNTLKQSGVNYVRKAPNTMSFSLNHGIYTGNNCGVTALSIAIAMGYKEIYLLGMDCRFDINMTKSHFHEGYKKRVDELSESTYDAFATFFENVGKHITQHRPDINVYNCSYISLVDIHEKYFKRKDIRDLLYADRYDNTEREEYISADVPGSP